MKIMANGSFKVTKPVEAVNKAATMKTEEIDLTIYGATPEPNFPTPSFAGRLNLNEFAFQQPSNAFRRHCPTPKTEESNSEVVKREEGPPKKRKGGSRARPLVLTPTPEPDDSPPTVKNEVKVESVTQVISTTTSESEHVSTPPKIEKLELNSPLIGPLQSTEWDLPIATVPKPEPGQEVEIKGDDLPRKKARYRERLVIEIEDSSPEPEVSRRSAAPTAAIPAPAQAPSTSAPAPSQAPDFGAGIEKQRARNSPLLDPSISSESSPSPPPAPASRQAASGMFAPPLARPGPSVLPTTQPPFLASASSSDGATSSRKRRADDSETGSPTKKLRAPSSYKPPETYAHLQELADLMAPDLLGIFVGVNPGLKSAAVGHSYAGPSNRFYKLLHTAGITERRLPPVEDGTLPAKYQMGNTNIVDRPTRNQMELSKHEMVDSVQALIDKVRKWKPESVVINGKKVWEIIWSVRHGRGLKKNEFKYGWQDDSQRMGTPKIWEKKETTVDGKPWLGARVFVAASTSGAAGIPRGPEKERIWREFGLWVNKRRQERGLTHYPPGPTYEKPKLGEVAAAVANVEEEE